MRVLVLTLRRLSILISIAFDCFLHISVCSATHQPNTDCEEICKIYNQNGRTLDYVLCNNFYTLAELNTYCGNLTMMPNYEIYPSKPLILTNEWNISLLNEKIFQNVNQTLKNVKIKNLLGIDLTLFINQSVSFDFFLNIKFIIQNSRLDFFYKKRLINDYCDSSFFDLYNGPYLFSHINRLTFSEYAKFTHKLCPYLFKGARLLTFNINYQINHFLKRNVFELNIIEQFENKSLDSVIKNFNCNGYKIRVDRSLLHEKVFEYLSLVRIVGSIDSFQADLFKELKLIRIVRLDMLSVRRFFHQFGIEWMHYLSTDLNKSELAQNSSKTGLNEKLVIVFIVQIRAGLLFSSISYTFPDEDFCIFANYPHQKLIYPLLNTFNMEHLSACTCTLFWIIKNQPDFERTLSSNDYNESYAIMNRLYEFCLQQGEHFAQQCSNQSSLIRSNCKSTANTTAYQEEFNLYELIILTKLWQFIISVILTPLACLFGFALNYLIFKNISYRRELNKEKFYRYMKINSLINCSFCFVYVFSLLCECIVRDGVYCSSLYTTKFAQYFKIYLISYLGNAAKICSNLTLLLMTINRYLLIGQDHFLVCKLIAAVSLRKIMFSIVLFSLCLSSVKLFQYEINIDLEEYEYPLMRVKGENELLGKILTIFIVLNDFFNFFAFLLVNTYFEALIVLKFHRELMEKRRKVKISSVAVLLIQTILARESRIERLRKKKSLNATYRKELRALLMIVLNGSMNFVLRLPEITSMIYFLFYYYFPTNELYYEVCKEYLLCYVFIDISKLFYILSFTCNFFMFYCFNFKFKSNFKWL